MSDNVLRFFNRLRFIFHGLLVPLINIFCGYALDIKEIKFYIILIITIVLSIVGVIVGIIAKLEVDEGEVLKRCIFSENQSKWMKAIFTLINVICVIYMIVVGIILYIRKKDYYFFLSGFFMLIFAAIGPATGSSYLIFLLSIYGEILMVIFLYLFFHFKDSSDNESIEDENQSSE